MWSSYSLDSIEAFKEAYPAAKLIGPGPLGEKRKDLKFDGCMCISSALRCTDGPCLVYLKDATETTFGFESDIEAMYVISTRFCSLD
jgi:hypothetical protein